jgi:hypothetical protein
MHITLAVAMLGWQRLCAEGYTVSVRHVVNGACVFTLLTRLTGHIRHHLPACCAALNRSRPAHCKGSNVLLLLLTSTLTVTLLLCALAACCCGCC